MMEAQWAAPLVFTEMDIGEQKVRQLRDDNRLEAEGMCT